MTNARTASSKMRIDAGEIAAWFGFERTRGPWTIWQAMQVRAAGGTNPPHESTGQSKIRNRAIRALARHGVEGVGRCREGIHAVHETLALEGTPDLVTEEHSGDEHAPAIVMVETPNGAEWRSQWAEIRAQGNVPAHARVRAEALFILTGTRAGVIVIEGEHALEEPAPIGIVSDTAVRNQIVAELETISAQARKQGYTGQGHMPDSTGVERTGASA